MESSNDTDLVSFAFSSPAPFDSHKPIFIDGQNPSRAFNATQFRLLVRSLIAGLQAHHVQRGDCVLVALENSVIHSAMFFGIVGAGGVYMGCDMGIPAHELNYLLELAEPRLIVTSPEALAKILEIGSLKGLSADRVCLVDEGSIDIIVQFAQVPLEQDGSRLTAPNSSIRLESLLQYGESDWVRFTDVEESKSTPAAMFLTSGTSGLPKAAIRTHHAIISHHLSVHYDVPYPVVRLMALPMYHSFGDFWTNIFPVRYGEPLYVLPRFEISSFLDTVAQHGITETYMVPAMVHILNQSSFPVRESLSSLRYVGVSGAPIDGDSMQRFQRLLSPDAVAGNLWGMTEVGVVFQNRYGETPQFGSVGRLLSGYELRFVDPSTGEDVGGQPESPGELYVRGPGLFLGYKGRTDAKDDQGWFQTGDMVYSRDGYYHIMGRTKDLIKVRGWSVAPAEIEGILLKDSRIKDAAVIGVMLADGSSEVPRAYVVRANPSSEPTGDEVAALVQCHLASYKALDGGVIFVDEIPRTGIGKPHRVKLSRLDRQRDDLISLLRLSVPAV
ncbi:nicotinic acid-CoA ligase pyr1 [Aspergillus clavatus NRRL 1]|uniref:Adenylate-forming enzyme, putative n=1 Tax=Aspergillus clavatus (strain ATCC 1007 / CBS 513.65 / DSM 816 / NCTC 3887 / NRRL 1 / QM 1276 / 107) TaxID=344612 RepID=A1CLJ4_ASPCL|nr:adenylate-forming enzyme, putative [Aspergillus clavatus NRRL 1]EAW10018.1 adenylate-forming enzyme, putative [Aspergillus clavatus NRRL 1]